MYDAVETFANLLEGDLTEWSWDNSSFPKSRELLR